MKKLDRDFIVLKNKIARMEKMGERAMARNYKATLDDLRLTMSRMYEQYETDGQLTFEEMGRYNRLDKLDDAIQVAIDGLYKKNSKVIRGTLTGVVKDTYSNSIKIVKNGLGGEVKKLKGFMDPIDVTKTINDRMAGLRWTERVGKHRSDVIYEVQKEVKLGLTQGDTYAQMSKRLKDKLENDGSKANLIIRTESHRCMGQAKEESFDAIAKGGVKFKEQWVSLGDERVRNAHDELDGVTIERGEMFYSPAGGVGPGPGLMGNAADDCNCRCIKILILE